MSSVFGNNVRKIRLMREMTQKDLASILGYADRSMVAKIETGKTEVSTAAIMKLGHALRVSPSIFFVDSTDYQNVEEYLPFLAVADEGTLNNIRKLLDMPSKKICKSMKEIS